MERTPVHSVSEQAADWVTRIQAGEVDPDHSGELRAWLAEDEEHARTFQRMLDVFSVSAAVVEHHDQRRSAGSAASGYSDHRFGLAAAASVLLAVAAGFWVFSASALKIETYTGERVLMSLEDGSSVHLNSQSRVGIEFNEEARVASLPQGEVLFAVNDEDPRPFLVHGKGVDVEVTGTTFQVTQYDDQVRVVVIEGEVKVRPSNTGGGSSEVTLHQGEQVMFADSILGKPTRVDPARLTGWREGWLYLDNQPVQELIDRLNRHYDGHIEVRDRELAGSEVSVALKLDRRDETLARLERLLQFDIEELPGDRSIVHGRR